MNAYRLAQTVIDLLKAEYGSDAVPYGLKGEIRREITCAVPSEKWNKGDWIEEIMFMAGDRHLNGKKIRTIDIALPEKVRSDMAYMDIDYRYFATVYYGDGTVEYSDLMGLWARLDNMGRFA